IGTVERVPFERSLKSAKPGGADGEKPRAAVPLRCYAGVDVLDQDEMVAGHAGGADALQAVDIGDAIRRLGSAVAACGPNERPAGDAEVLRREDRQLSRDLAPGALLQREARDLHGTRRGDRVGGVEHKPAA